MSETKIATVAIIGGGLVGSLNAIYFANRGWKVDLYELRPGKKTTSPIVVRACTHLVLFNHRHAFARTEKASTWQVHQLGFI
jgi:2-polyprenyl-6-methoxyphenol hydroxylase-like FAD-dependent oxidoreductase